MWKIGSIREIVSGQQKSHLDGGAEIESLKIHILSPVAIHEGYFDPSQTSVKYAKSEKDIEQMHRLHKFAQPGDIVLKLFSPYEACLIGNITESYVVPSYCCIIRPFLSTSVPHVPSEYICAVLNSEMIKEQIAERMSGSKNPTLRISDFKELLIPVKDMKAMRNIGELFMISAQNRRNFSKLIDSEERLLNNLIKTGEER